jgi:hypothetical protein
MHPGSSPGARTKYLGVTMAKSSLDYSERMGLMIALSNLEAAVDVTYQDEEWIVVTNWMKQRIKELGNK